MLRRMRIVGLSKRSAEERARLSEELGKKATAPRNGQAVDIDARLRAFEVRYEMTSTEMRVRFSRGEVRDTADVARWLMLLRARDR
jgi:hypothetical protein